MFWIASAVFAYQRIMRLQLALANEQRLHAVTIRKISDSAAIAAQQALTQTEKSNRITAKIEEDYEHEKNLADRLRAELHADNVRLRIARTALSDSADSGKLPSAGTAPGQHNDADYAEFDKQTTNALFGIARDGDDAALKATFLQAYAREAQRVCGVKFTQKKEIE